MGVFNTKVTGPGLVVIQVCKWCMGGGGGGREGRCQVLACASMTEFEWCLGGFCDCDCDFVIVCVSTASRVVAIMFCTSIDVFVLSFSLPNSMSTRVLSFVLHIG